MGMLAWIENLGLGMGFIYGLRYSSGVLVLGWGRVTRVEFQNEKLGLFEFGILH